MAAKGYCLYTDIEAMLGITLTAAQQTKTNELIEAAEIYIDNETGRGWLTGAQTDEAHFQPDEYIWLRYAPVSTVTAITGRYYLGDTETALTVNEDYEVIDLETGQIRLVYPASWDRILADYTPDTAVPPLVKTACEDIVASWLQPTLRTGSYGLDSYSLPDLSIKFSRSHVQAAIPPLAQSIIDKLRWPVAS